MTRYVPYTKLLLHDTHSIALAANGHIQVLDSSTGSVLHSTATSPELTEKVDKSGEVVAAVVDTDGRYLVTATASKSVIVWELPSLRIVNEREVPKKPTDIYLTRDAQMLVADKFGDVHRYPLLASDSAKSESHSSTLGNTKAKASGKRLEDEALLLGHVSLLTSVLLSADEKYIITADRDEHIRVSWYPDSYVIEAYCLGSKKFVSALHIPSWDSSRLVSGGGDPVLKIWNWREGKLIFDIPIADVVTPFIKVTRKKSGDGEDEADKEGEGDDKRKGKNKKKDKRAMGSIPAEEDCASKDGAVDMQVDVHSALGARTDGHTTNDETTKEPTQPAPLLAIQKISSFASDSVKLLIFSAYGSTALFYCNYPESSTSSPHVRSLALNKPVLDFSLWPNTNEIWIAIDGNWSDSISSSTDDGTTFIRVAKIIGDELILSDESAHQQLAHSLSTISRLQVPAESLKKFDLYSALAVLPKNVDAEHNAMDVETQLSDATAGKLSGKEIGRLKSKKAILARQSSSPNRVGQNSTSEEERDLKRQKSESEADVK